MSTQLRSALCTLVSNAIIGIDPSIKLQLDPNHGFDPPQNAPWVRVTIKDGGQTIAGVGGSAPLWRGPVALYVDLFVPQNSGDGFAVDACEVLRPAIRQYRGSGLRFLRFEPGEEGLANGWYLKQLIGIYERTERD